MSTIMLTYYAHGERRDPKIALTFDDGPNPFATERVLRILRDYRVSASFFLIGRWAVRYPHLVRAIVADGHLIGNHSFSHWRSDFIRAGEVIKRITGAEPCFLRAPHLDLSMCASLAQAYLKKVRIVNFDLDSFDFLSDIPASKIRSRVIKLACSGSIIDFHDGSEQSTEWRLRPQRMLKVLPGIIRDLQQRFQLVRLDELRLSPVHYRVSTEEPTSRHPNVTLKVVFRYRNKILLLRHDDGTIEFPGGQMEFGESMFAALCRELREEIAYDLKKMPKIFDTWNYISRTGKRHSVMLYYKIVLPRLLKTKSPEGLEMMWLTERDCLDIFLLHSNRRELKAMFH